MSSSRSFPQHPPVSPLQGNPVKPLPSSTSCRFLLELARVVVKSQAESTSDINPVYGTLGGSLSVREKKDVNRLLLYFVCFPRGVGGLGLFAWILTMGTLFLLTLPLLCSAPVSTVSTLLPTSHHGLPEGTARVGQEKKGTTDLGNCSGATLPKEQQRELAKQFAPFLIFHPEEKYFPCSPLFLIEQKDKKTDSSSSSLPDRVHLLGTSKTRADLYELLSLHEKEILARTYYRAFRCKKSNLVILEYWFYYVKSEYRARGGLFPFWVDASHPNDLEFVRLILRSPAVDLGDKGSDASQNYKIVAVISSAHGERVPDHRYRFSEEQRSPKRLTFLVELGSHAIAADIDQDGRFTPDVDSQTQHKLVWGIRDRGHTWAYYNSSYMDPRHHQTSIYFYPVGFYYLREPGKPPRRLSYRLAHVAQLREEFSQIELTKKKLTELFETKVSWPKRLFGKSAGNAQKLLLPPEKLSSGSLSNKSFSSTERGPKAGVSTLVSDPAIFVGGRYAFFNKSRCVPDLILDGELLLTRKAGQYISTSLLGSYPLDATTKFLFGMGLVGESVRYRRSQLDWVAGIDITLGRVRISNLFRRVGPVTHSGFDLRLYYLF